MGGYFTWRRAIAAVVLVVALWLYGAIHVIYGKGLGITTCWKVGWSYSDTFVDFERVPDAAELMPTKVVAAIDKCQIVPDESAWTRDTVILAFAFAIGFLWLIFRLTKRAEKHIKGD
jgi:hypothetical protein